MSEHYIHRGLAKKSFKENTLSAFKYSFEKKYGIETDLHVTKDNQLICFHDYVVFLGLQNLICQKCILVDT